MSEPIYIVSGFPRSGTSMMMRALEAGGVPCLYDPDGDAARNAACPIEGYQPNPHGFYELNNVHQLDWATAVGKAVKLINGNLHTLPSDLPYRVVYMVRSPLELRRSFPTVHADVRQLTAYRAAVRSDLAILRRLNAETVVISFPSLVSRPIAELSRLRWPIDTERAARTIDPALYRHRRAA
jgi:hypothetical protein